MSENRLFISFSGGETSAEMAIRILQNDAMRTHYDKIVIGVANTSSENEAWRDFVHLCDVHFFTPAGCPLAWIEPFQYHGQRKGAGHTLTNHVAAKMDNSLFEDMIRKYGIPNQKYLHCTRELKLNPMISYCQSIGWDRGSYDTAIGIRADEIDRMSAKAKENRIIYPLIKWRVTKSDVNLAWRDRPFRLRAKGYQSNCRFCFKKSFRKHFTIISETPDAYDFPRRMEAENGFIGGEFKKARKGEQTLPSPDYRRKFFRGNRSTDDLFTLYDEQKDVFRPADDDAQFYPQPSMFDDLLDTAGGCGESCEVWADDDLIETAP